MMKMQIKFFEGETNVIEEKFNQWSCGDKYIAETSLHFKGKDRTYGVMKVVYGESPSNDQLPKKEVQTKKNKFSLY